MRVHVGRLQLSASDLANHLGCPHLTALDLAAAKGKVSPPRWQDPALEVLHQRGFQHEAEYIAHLRDSGLQVVELHTEDGSAFEATVAAMRSGVDVIVQATLKSGQWHGRADVLRRVQRCSALGDWSYEVIDTKLARETRAGTILQLCLYSEIVAELQELLPEFMHVVPPAVSFDPETFRVHDFLAYYRFVRARLHQAVHDSPTPAASSYPEPVPQCDICRWWPRCNQQRHDDDHLSLVAGVSKLQRVELSHRDVRTLAALAQLPLPIKQPPRRGAMEGYVRVREQARVQLESRQRNKPVYELLPVAAGRGLTRLPEPSPGDIFFDIEGDAFVGTAGLEYLLGWVFLGERGRPKYCAQWANDSAQERVALEAFVDEVMLRWRRFPDLHIYHFAPYEPGAVKRLMGRYATREDEIDRMLRAGLFVDLYGVTRQAVRAGVERYSIKDLEQFYGFHRSIELRRASANLRELERALELNTIESVSVDARQVVADYNRDDCLSTLCLRAWLEQLRSRLEAGGETIPRPSTGDGAPNEIIEERQQRVEWLMTRVAAEVPPEREKRSEEQHARWLLANMLDWHRREEKAPWWEYFRLAALDNEELLEESAGISGLKFLARVGGTDNCPVHQYHFEPQDTSIQKEDTLRKVGGDKLGSVSAIDLIARTIDIRKRSDTADFHPVAAFAHEVIKGDEQAESLFRLGAWVSDNGIDVIGNYRAARDLLLARAPRLPKSYGNRSALQGDSEKSLRAARRLANQLDCGILPIQGPPGAGKTYTGARMICELVRTGKKVGITAVSHKVIRNLLDAAVEAANEEGLSMSCIQKVRGKPAKDEPDCITETASNEALAKALMDGIAQVAAGTAWLWAREELFESVDTLFVDEAGQMSLANVLAVAQAARNLVLLGDTQQLEQPQKGSHPQGTDVSALEHLLVGHRTIPPDRGLFLAETWRLHPSICAFASEQFYDNRLKPHADLANQSLLGPTPFAGAGLWFVPVEHVGNQTSSLEEADRVTELYRSILLDGVSWISRKGTRAQLTEQDILIVAPYNAHVSAIGERLPNARVGTVDRFQGQEAPVVIYSMATSSPEEAPRGMEFLFSLNRLNVASSRSQCICILVACPKLFELECQTPRQMQLANAFCRYLEMAQTL